MVWPERLPRRRLVLSAAPAAWPVPARQTRGGEGGALQAAGGGGRRAPGGAGGRRGGLNTNLPPKALGFGDAAPTAPDAPSPAAPAPSGREPGGLPGPPRPAPPPLPGPAAPCARARARGSPGKPGRRRLPCALPGSPASGRPLGSAPGQRARWVSACGPSASPRSSSTLAAPGALAPWHTHSRGQVVAERFEDSLGLQTALAPTVRGGQSSFLSILCPSYIFLTWNFFFFSPKKLPEITLKLCFAPWKTRPDSRVLAQTEGKGEPGSSPTTSATPKETALTPTPRSPQAAPDCAVKRKRERETGPYPSRWAGSLFADTASSSAPEAARAAGRTRSLTRRVQSQRPDPHR